MIQYNYWRGEVQVGILVGVVSGVHSSIFPDTALSSLQQEIRWRLNKKSFSEILIETRFSWDLILLILHLGTVTCSQKVTHVEADIFIPGEPGTARSVSTGQFTRPDIRHVGGVAYLIQLWSTKHNLLEWNTIISRTDNWLNYGLITDLNCAGYTKFQQKQKQKILISFTFP